MAFPFSIIYAEDKIMHQSLSELSAFAAVLLHWNLSFLCL